MIYNSCDREHNILKLFILGHFLPFYPLKNPQNQNFEKWKDLLEISWFYTCVPKITIIWCTVPNMWDTEFFVILGHFLSFTTPLMIPKIKILKKKWKKCLDILHILHRHTINNNHMMYGSWDKECDRQTFLSFWIVFCPFLPLKNPKIKILRNEKICSGIIILLVMKNSTYPDWFIHNNTSIVSCSHCQVLS